MLSSTVQTSHVPYHSPLMSASQLVTTFLVWKKVFTKNDTLLQYLFFLCLVSPDDYGSVSTVLAFSACDTQQCIEIQIQDDIIVELTEPFSVTLERTPGLDSRIILDPVHSKIDITDNDGVFIISLT